MRLKLNKSAPESAHCDEILALSSSTSFSRGRWEAGQAQLHSGLQQKGHRAYRTSSLFLLRSWENNTQADALYEQKLNAAFFLAMNITVIFHGKANSQPCISRSSLHTATSSKHPVITTRWLRIQTLPKHYTGKGFSWWDVYTALIHSRTELWQSQTRNII